MPMFGKWEEVRQRKRANPSGLSECNSECACDRECMHERTHIFLGERQREGESMHMGTHAVLTM